MIPPQSALNVAKGVSIIIVTFKRPLYLQALLRSISLSAARPECVLVVDNASDDECARVVAEAAATLEGTEVIYKPLPTNVGGSGGFHQGVKEALARKSEWMWLMDDDVEVLPDGLGALLTVSRDFKCIQGRRIDFDGSPFFFQPHLSLRLGVPLPKLGNVFRNKYFLTNCGCFEGMFIHRSIVERIGLPDPRFFITWDDVVYGWLASRITEVVCIDAFVMKRSRPQRQISLVVRHLNDSSDLSRYYVMRNRAYLELYFREFGIRHPVWFRVGTFLTLCKELLRLIAVEHSLSGINSLMRGMRAARKLRNDKTWRPMAPVKS